MDQPESEWLIQAVRAAKGWRTTPLTFLGVTDDSQWTDEDRLLAQAFDVFEATRIDRLGFYRRDSEESDGEGWYEVEEVLNFAQQALDIEQGNEKKREPGVSLRVVDTRITR